MDLIADILLALGAFGAGLYCHVLSRRLSKFQNLKSGMGGAIAVLSAQVDELQTALAGAKSSARESVSRLAEVSSKAEAATTRLEVILASMHDIPKRERVEEISPFFPRGDRG